MNTEQLLAKTQQQIKYLRTNGKKRHYPQTIKDAVIKLADHMSGSSIANSLSLSKSFVCKTIRHSNKKSCNTSKTTIPSQEYQTISDLPFLEITNELKGLVKEDTPRLIPAMRFTTNNGIIIEIFS